jgi:tripartite-type tricarboxylate transporter receptor subunit TctC
VVNPSFPAKTVKELVRYAKDHPVSYAASTLGGVIHLAGVILNTDAGIKMQMIPYKQGGPAALNDVVAGHVQATFADPSLVPSLAAAGKIRLLGVSGSSRMATLPDVPTIAEAGIPGFDATSWHMMVAPAKTPQAIVERVHAEMKAIIALPEIKDRMQKIGMTQVDSPSVEALRAFVASENARWGRIVKDAGVAGSQ